MITFNRVPEPKTVKNRSHFDIEVNEGVGHGPGTRRSSGTTDDFDEYGFRWRVMSDPEGNGSA